MMTDYLDFEKPIAELEEKIAELQRVSGSRDIDLNQEIENLRARSDELTKEIFAKLSAWQIVQLARHALRPHALDFIRHMCDDFDELHGDRMFADDAAIVAGLAHIDGMRVAVIGHQKGREPRERTRRNFGMPRPEGYRKARRVMQLAERFKLPLVTLIDTSGAYPGVGAEERGQSEAIAKCLETMSALRTPIVSSVIGEGGSGGALAIGVCDKLLMLQYAIYSVISPEGCASILWKRGADATDKDAAAHAAFAADALKVTTSALSKYGLVDTVVREPLGGAHRDYVTAAARLKSAVTKSLRELGKMSIDALLEQRYARLMSFGRFDERKSNPA